MPQQNGSSPFKKATKKAAKLRLALIGPPGSGKTYSSLVFAAALAEQSGGKIAVIDTEKGSASKYADLFEFDVMELEGSFHPNRYVAAIRAAEEAGYGILVIDSLSHAWIGEGGGLDLHDKAVARQKVKNSFTAWGDVTPHHNKLVQALVQCRCHVIGTMRSKVEYAQEKDERTGKTNIRKIGTAPLMRDGLEYEFDVVGDIDTDHNLVISKSRCPAVADRVFARPGRDFIGNVIQWLGGSPPSAQEERQASPPQQTSQARKNAPADGAELEAKIKSAEEKFVASGRCAAGELFDYMRKQGELLGQPPEFVRWSVDVLALTPDWFETFRSLHPAPQANGTSPPAAAAPAAPARYVTAERAKALQELCHRKGFGWASTGLGLTQTVCGARGWPKSRMPEDLTQFEYEQLVEDLNAHPDREKART